MLDMNNYWLLAEEDSENLRYVVDNFKPLKIHVRSIDEGRKELVNENLEGKVLDFEPKGKGYLFKVDGKELFYFEGLRQKSFDVRYRLGRYNSEIKEFDENSALVTADYEKKEYVEIHFKGKIGVEPSEKERAPGIPFYRIKKS